MGQTGLWNKKICGTHSTRAHSSLRWIALSLALRLMMNVVALSPALRFMMNVIRQLGRVHIKGMHPTEILFLVFGSLFWAEVLDFDGFRSKLFELGFYFESKYITDQNKGTRNP